MTTANCHPEPSFSEAKDPPPPCHPERKRRIHFLRLLALPQNNKMALTSLKRIAPCHDSTPTIARQPIRAKEAISGNLFHLKKDYIPLSLAEFHTYEKNLLTPALILLKIALLLELLQSPTLSLSLHHLKLKKITPTLK